MEILIVEDSKIAAMVLVKLLKDSELQGQTTIASSIREARQFIRNRKYDLIFLDVHLQDGKGPEIINELSPDQKLIFVTSDPEYAITAFEHNALDYLVKPVDKARFDKTIKRLQVKNEDEGNIVIRADFNFHKIRLADILFAKSNGDYITLTTTSNSYTFHGTLKDFIEKLPSDTFKRCQRSYIVNMDNIDQMDKKTLIVKGHEIPVNDAFKKEMSRRFSGK